MRVRSQLRQARSIESIFAECCPLPWSHPPRSPRLSDSRVKLPFGLPLGRLREQRDRGVLALEVLHLPLGREQDHAALLAILRHGRAAAERWNLQIRLNPSCDRVRRRLDESVDVIF